MINKRLAFLFLLFWIIIPGYLFAQEQFTQTIRGMVVDKLSKSPLPGATIALLGGETTTGTSSDVNGNFRLENVTIGRRTIQIRFLGYEPITINNLIVSSAKEINLYLELEEKAFTAEEVIVVCFGNLRGLILETRIILLNREQPEVLSGCSIITTSEIPIFLQELFPHNMEMPYQECLTLN